MSFFGTHASRDTRLQHIFPRTHYFSVSILWCFHVCSRSLQITVGSDRNHESKRHLLLGRKAVTNLESILRSRDVTLLTKVCIVKAMVSPVVMDGYESWSIKKADAFKLWCWRRLLRVSWITNLSVLKEINPEYSLEGLMHKDPVLWLPDVKSWLIRKDLMLGKIEGRRRR